MERDRSRGQLLLIAGLGIAVAFVVLAVVLNTAIYTEHLATRDTVPGQQAITFERSAEEGTGGLVSLVNYYNNEDYSTLHDHLANEVQTWDANTSIHGTAYGMIRGASLLGVENGTRIIQDRTRNFTDDDGNASWTLATSVNETRRFRMTVTRSSLHQPSVFDTITGTDSYRLNVSDGTSTWGMYVYQNQSDSSIVMVKVRRPDGTTDTCSAAQSTVEIDVTQGTVAGENCAPLNFSEGVSAPYDISYDHAKNAEGRYVLFVDRERQPLLADIPGDVYHDRESDFSPYTVPAVYAANISVTFQRPDLTYEAMVRVAPPEPLNGETYTVGGEPLRELVYVDSASGLLSTVNAAHDVTQYNASSARAIGPKEVDFDGDGLREIPYVNSSNVLKLIDANNETQVLASGAAASKTLLGVGTWRGETSVFYSNSTNSDYIYRASPGEPAEMVLVGGNGVQAGGVAGVADYNSDGDNDLVFTGTSQEVRYIDGDNTIDVGRSVGASNGIGIGEPREFDGAGHSRAPMIDGSNNVGLLTFDNQKTAMTSQGVAEKAPVAGIDLVGGVQLEVVYIEASSDTLYYVTFGGTKKAFTDGSGNPIKPVIETGVA